MTTDGRKDLQQRPGPGRIKTRWRARQDQRGTRGGSEGTEQGEEQQYPEGEPEPQGRVASGQLSPPEGAQLV